MAQLLTGLAEQVAGEQTLPAEPAQRENCATLLRAVAGSVTSEGVGVVLRCLHLMPLAAARGDAREELDLALERFGRNLRSSLVITLDPRQPKRAQVEITSLGAARVTPLLSLTA